MSSPFACVCTTWSVWADAPSDERIDAGSRFVADPKPRRKGQRHTPSPSSLATHEAVPTHCFCSLRAPDSTDCDSGSRSPSRSGRLVDSVGATQRNRMHCVSFVPVPADATNADEYGYPRRGQNIVAFRSAKVVYSLYKKPRRCSVNPSIRKAKSPILTGNFRGAEGDNGARISLDLGSGTGVFRPQSPARSRTSAPAHYYV